MGDPRNIAQIILDTREKMNLSQDELARRIGISRQTLSSWENEKTSPKANELHKIADAFGASTSALFNTNENDSTSDATTQLKSTGELKEDITQRYPNIEVSENEMGRMVFQIIQNNRKVRVEFSKDDPENLVDLMMDKAILAIERSEDQSDQEADKIAK